MRWCMVFVFVQLYVYVVSAMVCVYVCVCLCVWLCVFLCEWVGGSSGWCVCVLCVGEWCVVRCICVVLWCICEHILHVYIYVVQTSIYYRCAANINVLCFTAIVADKSLFYIDTWILIRNWACEAGEREKKWGQARANRQRARSKVMSFSTAAPRCSCFCSQLLIDSVQTLITSLTLLISDLPPWHSLRILEAFSKGSSHDFVETPCMFFAAPPFCVDVI